MWLVGVSADYHPESSENESWEEAFNRFWTRQERPVADQTDDRTLKVTAVPAVFDRTLDPNLLRDVLVEFLQRKSAAETSVEIRTDALLGDLACYPSITGNTSLTEGSVRELLDALDACENPYTCPHGRPVVIKISDQELEERFERDYPGHSR